MPPGLEIGATLHGYCNGYFGRDYLDKLVEGFGKDWIVARSTDGLPLIATFEDVPQDQIAELVLSWL